MEVGGVENGCFGNFLPTIDLRHNAVYGSEFQLLFGFVWFWKIRLFYTQDGTNMAQGFTPYCDRIVTVFILNSLAKESNHLTVNFFTIPLAAEDSAIQA
jgi:hypothetical protein